MLVPLMAKTGVTVTIYMVRDQVVKSRSSLGKQFVFDQISNLDQGDRVIEQTKKVLAAPGCPSNLCPRLSALESRDWDYSWESSNIIWGQLSRDTADADAFVNFQVCPKRGVTRGMLMCTLTLAEAMSDAVPLYRRVVKADYFDDLCDSKCWLFDKEERMRKAAAYFAGQRIAAAAAEETV